MNSVSCGLERRPLALGSRSARSFFRRVGCAQVLKWQPTRRKKPGADRRVSASGRRSRPHRSGFTGDARRARRSRGERARTRGERGEAEARSRASPYARRARRSRGERARTRGERGEAEASEPSEPVREASEAKPRRASPWRARREASEAKPRRASPYARRARRSRGERARTRGERGEAEASEPVREPVLRGLQLPAAYKGGWVPARSLEVVEQIVRGRPSGFGVGQQGSEQEGVGRGCW